jgi:hypothetical protein
MSGSWWATEKNKSAWIEFTKVNKVQPKSVTPLTHRRVSADVEGLRPEEVIIFHNFDVVMMRAKKLIRNECGLSPNKFLTVEGCCSKTCTSYVLQLKMNYRPENIE